METHSSIPAWRIPMDREAWRATDHGVSESDTTEWLSIAQHIHITIYKIKKVLPYSFPGGSDGKASACNMGDPDSIPGPGRSPGEVNGNPLQYPCLKKSMDGGAWWATVHGVTKSGTWLSNFTSPYSTRNYTQYFVITYMEKEFIHLNNFAIHLKVTQHYKSTILQ